MVLEALNNSQISELVEQLISRKAELSLQLSQSEENAEPVTLDQQSVGRVSRIDAIQQQQMAVANRGQSALMLKQVCAALRRVESSKFGFCLQCGEPIGFARLEAQPHTPNCLECQSALEQA